jgi:hypothetical protein
VVSVGTGDGADDWVFWLEGRRAAASCVSVSCIRCEPPLQQTIALCCRGIALTPRLHRDVQMQAGVVILVCGTCVACVCGTYAGCATLRVACGRTAPYFGVQTRVLAT